jgi:hypothetical protein
MSQHRLRPLSFASLTSEHWESLPNLESIKRQIGDAILAQSEVYDEAIGFYSPPHEIRDIHLTHAAADQIRFMWHGHRKTGRRSPPTIPLKFFVTGFGQSNGRTCANVEIHPGMDRWETD